MASTPQLRTGVWHGDRPLQLDFPADWEVEIFWPRTPPPLTDEQIHAALERPVESAPIRELCRGKSHPLVIVDDLNRPTPASRVMPHLLRHFADAGIPASRVTILMAGGSHGYSQSDPLRRKVGPLAAESCRLVVHDPACRGVNLGRTSFGSPVLVDRELATSDFVMGIGGIYPNQTAGFGGGTKLALGALELRAISWLHRTHPGVGWGNAAAECDFRKELNEIAERIGLRTMICTQLDAQREIVRLACGDPVRFYAGELAFARRTFGVALPEGADVVITNAYPNDLSFTFVWMKGLTPLKKCPPAASRIVIASCSEGLGSHGVYPVVNPPKFHAQRDALRRLSVMSPSQIAQRLVGRVSRAVHAGANGSPASNHEPKPAQAKHRNPIWMYRPGTHAETLPKTLRGIQIRNLWGEIIEAVRREQGDRHGLRVLVYACAPLQYFEPSARTAEKLRKEAEAVETLAAR